MKANVVIKYSSTPLSSVRIGEIVSVTSNLKILELVNPPNSLIERLLIRLEMKGFLISIINSEKLQAVSDDITT